MDGIVRAVPIHIGAWSGQCEMTVLYLRDFELILRMDFPMVTEVGILPYLGALAFLEHGTFRTVNTLREGDVAGSNLNLTIMVSIIEILGDWPERSGNLDIAYHKPLGSGLEQTTDGWGNSEAEYA